MALQFRSTSKGFGNAPLGVIPPAGFQPGDLFVATINHVRGAPTSFAIAPSGWVVVNSGLFGTNSEVILYTRMATSTEPSGYTFDDTRGRVYSVIITALTGASGLPEGSSFKSGGANTTQTAGTLTALSTNNMLVAGFAQDQGLKITPTGSMTIADSGSFSNAVICAAYELLTASGDTGSRTAQQGNAAWGNVMVVIPPSPSTPSLDDNVGLFLAGHFPINSSIPLVIPNSYAQTNNNIPLYLKVPSALSGSIPLCLASATSQSNNIPLFVAPFQTINGTITLFITSAISVNNNIPLFAQGPLSVNNNIPLFIVGLVNSSTSGIPLFIPTFATLNNNIPLFISPNLTKNSGIPCFIPSNLTINSGIPLVVPNTFTNTTKNIPLFAKGPIAISGSIPLYMLPMGTVLQASSTIPLYITGPVPINSGIPLTVFNQGAVSLGVTLLLAVNDKTIFNNHTPLFLAGPRTSGANSFYRTPPLYLEASKGQSPTSHVPLFVAGPGTGTNFLHTPLFLAVSNTLGANTAGIPLYINPPSGSIRSIPLYTNAPGALIGGNYGSLSCSLYLARSFIGAGIPMVMQGPGQSQILNIPLVVSTAANTSRSIPLVFSKTVGPVNKSMPFSVNGF